MVLNVLGHGWLTLLPLACGEVLYCMGSMRGYTQLASWKPESQKPERGTGVPIPSQDMPPAATLATRPNFLNVPPPTNRTVG